MCCYSVALLYPKSLCPAGSIPCTGMTPWCGQCILSTTSSPAILPPPSTRASLCLPRYSDRFSSLTCLVYPTLPICSLLFFHDTIMSTAHCLVYSSPLSCLLLSAVLSTLLSLSLFGHSPLSVILLLLHAQLVSYFSFDPIV